MTTTTSIPKDVEVLIELRDVTVRSTIDPHVCWTRNWHWSIAAGDRWLVGALPGSGKTPLISVAAGLTPPAQGSVSFFQKEIQDLEPESWLNEKLRIGMVFEDGGKIFHELTVFENLLLPLDYHERGEVSERHKRVESVLHWTEMTALAREPAARLSRNWQQRLGLARALTLRPDVLFLDHPLGAVDAHHALWWQGFMDRLMGGTWEWKPKSFVVSASDLNPWLPRVNRLALINDGNWVEMNPADRNALSKDPLFQSLIATQT